MGGPPSHNYVQYPSVRYTWPWVRHAMPCHRYVQRHVHGHTRRQRRLFVAWRVHCCMVIVRCPSWVRLWAGAAGYGSAGSGSGGLIQQRHNGGNVRHWLSSHSRCHLGPVGRLSVVVATTRHVVRCWWSVCWWPWRSRFQNWQLGLGRLSTRCPWPTAGGGAVCSWSTMFVVCG